MMKVIKILNNFQIVINKGSENGIEVGISIAIYEKGEEIKVNNDIINIDKLKKELVVVYVTNKYSILEHPKEYSIIDRDSNKPVDRLMNTIETVGFGISTKTVNYPEEKLRLFTDLNDEKYYFNSDKKIEIDDIAKIM